MSPKTTKHSNYAHVLFEEELVKEDWHKWQMLQQLERLHAKLKENQHLLPKGVPGEWDPHKAAGWTKDHIEKEYKRLEPYLWDIPDPYF